MILCATDAWFILCTNKIYRPTYVLKKSYFMFPIAKGSENAPMKLAGFCTSNKVKNHWYRVYHPICYQGDWCYKTGQYGFLRVTEKNIQIVHIPLIKHIIALYIIVVFKKIF